MKYCQLFYRIPFSETDAMGIVHHSNHAKYLERGRIEFLRLVNLDYATIMKRKMNYPVLELRTIFKKPLEFDEVILIETSISQVTRTRLNFAYRVFSVPELKAPSLSNEAFSGPAPSVLGETFHCCVDGAGRPMLAEPDILARLQEVWGGES